MTTKKPQPKADILIRDDGTPEIQQIAKMIHSPEYASALASKTFVNGVLPEPVPIGEMARQVKNSIEQVQAGDMSGMEAMLVGQAHALQQVFMNLMNKASKQEHLKQYQAYMNAGLRAQAQSRATIQALTELKYPRQVVITKQANFAHGHQQVNNGTPAPEKLIEQNQLLEHSDANTLPQRMDTRTKATTGRIDTGMETVGEIYRSQDTGR